MSQSISVLHSPTLNHFGTCLSVDPACLLSLEADDDADPVEAPYDDGDGDDDDDGWGLVLTGVLTFQEVDVTDWSLVSLDSRLGINSAQFW